METAHIHKKAFRTFGKMQANRDVFRKLGVVPEAFFKQEQLPE